MEKKLEEEKQDGEMPVSVFDVPGTS